MTKLRAVLGSLAAIGVLAGAGGVAVSAGLFEPRARVAEPAIVELGQFAAAITRADGMRGHLLIQARAEAPSQDASLALSRRTPAIRHAVLRTVQALAARGEADLTLDGAATAIQAAVNDAFGAEIVHAVYIDRLLVQ